MNHDKAAKAVIIISLKFNSLPDDYLIIKKENSILTSSQIDVLNEPSLIVVEMFCGIGTRTQSKILLGMVSSWGDRKWMKLFK